MIKEVIVVEGKDDITAVKAAVDAEVMSTNGFKYKKGLIRTLRQLACKRGIIILTDPDYAGEQIRRDLNRRIPNCKHAFLPQGKALKEGDIGVENATKEDIIDAIFKARPNKVKREIIFTQEDMIEQGLIGASNSKEKRDKLGHLLGIGYGNSKQFLNRLNNFGITKEEFLKGIEGINLNE
ncbi:MAG TPA: ribonuclease M5 [Tissierellaceae bacterium]|nr:ribonuclease M5 [Tissierellaceae bacterium]